MHINVKKFISCLSIVTMTMLSLTGCTSSKKSLDTFNTTNSGNQAKGRFIETELDLPVNKDFYAELVQDEADNLSMIHTEVKSKQLIFFQYTLNPDHSWSEHELASVPFEHTECYSPHYFKTAKGKEYLCFSSDGDTASEQFFKKTKNGWKKVAVEGWDQKDESMDTMIVPSEVAILDDGSLIASIDGDINLYDPDTGKLTKSLDIDTTNFSSLAFSGQNILATKVDPSTYLASSIFIYNVQKGTSKELPCPDNHNMYSYHLVEKGDQIYTVNSIGIQSIQEGTSKWQILADGSLTSLYLPYMSVMSFVPVSDTEYYVLCTIDDTVHLYKYTFDETVNAVPDKEITVYALNDNSLIRQAVVSFQQNHPDVRVTLNIAMKDDDDTNSKEDYIRSLNTSLLAGQGDDLLVLDGLPYESYQKKGVLADLTDCIQPMLDKGELLSNVFDPFHIDNGYYYVPTKFSPLVVIGNGDSASACTSLEGIITYAKTNTDRSILGKRTSTKLIEMFLPAALPSMRNHDGSLNEKNLHTFLKQLQEIYTLTDGISVLDPDYDENDVNNLGDTFDLASSITIDVTRSDGYMMTCFDLAIMQFIHGSISSYEHAFHPTGLLGINKASKQKKLAEEFLLYTLSPQMQAKDLLDGHPVNTKSLNDYYQRKFDDAETIIKDASGNFVPFHVKTPDKASIDQLLAICKSVDLCTSDDEIMTEKITESAEQLLAGKMTLEDAVKTILQDLKLYSEE